MSLTRATLLAASTLALALIAVVLSVQPATAIYDRDCADFRTQKQAQRFYKNHNPNRDPHRLDADRDGIACEALP
jgi:hypothetical protein